jgi:hypothetical protein
MSGAPVPFVLSGKDGDTMYSVRTAAGEAVCTSAYNPAREERSEWAEIVVAALNAYAPAVAKAAGSTP